MRVTLTEICLHKASEVAMAMATPEEAEAALAEAEVATLRPSLAETPTLTTLSLVSLRSKRDGSKATAEELLILAKPPPPTESTLLTRLATERGRTYLKVPTLTQPSLQEEMGAELLQEVAAA